MSTSGKDQYFAAQLLNAILGGSGYSKVPTIYFGLFSSMPDGTNTGAEISGGNYSRAAYTNDASLWTFTSPNQMKNAPAVQFPTASSSWGTIVGFGLFSAATSGTLMYFGPLTTPQIIGLGDLPIFPIGALVVTED